MDLHDQPRSCKKYAAVAGRGTNDRPSSSSSEVTQVLANAFQAGANKTCPIQVLHVDPIAIVFGTDDPIGDGN